MQYKIVQSDSVIEFQKKVNGSLDAGWLLYGNPMLTYNEYGYTKMFAQAMTFEGE